jgi:hypothetical protein
VVLIELKKNKYKKSNKGKINNKKEDEKWWNRQNYLKDYQIIGLNYHINVLL